MKTAISVPNDVFARAERFAHRRHMTRSALFTAAVREYIQRHRRENVTRKLNEVYGGESSSLDPVLSQLQGLSIPQEEW